MLKPLKITFTLDGSGVVLDPHEPIHLDALLGAILAPHQGLTPPMRDEAPADIRMPLGRWRWRPDPAVWGHCASALTPVGETAESMDYRRRKMQQDRLHMTKGTWNTQIGTGKEWNVGLPLVLCTSMVGYVLGGRKEIAKLFRRGRIRYLGRDRARGRGRVVDVSVETVDHDWSVVRDGQAMRYLPVEDSTRACRPRPPYWNNVDTRPMCDVGDYVEAGDYLW